MIAGSELESELFAFLSVDGICCEKVGGRISESGSRISSYARLYLKVELVLSGKARHTCVQYPVMDNIMIVILWRSPNSLPSTIKRVLVGRRGFDFSFSVRF